MAEHIGLIGVGAMGGPMGQNLLKAGHALVIYSRTKTRPEVEQLVRGGAAYVASPAEVGRGANVVITMVGNADDARQVTRGVLSTMARGGMIIGMETIDPATRRDLEAEASAKGVAYLDAPVSGGTIGAERGTLTIMVGSTKEAFERARPILSALGTNIYHCGPIGTGAVAKLSNNWIYLASMVSVVQAARMAQRAKLDEASTHEIWLKSTGDCVAVRTRVPFRQVVQNNPVDQDYRPGYPIEHALKDLKLIESSARELGVSTVGMADVISVYEQAVQRGLAKKDISAIAEVLR
ncbi:MAG TPA: NAD(P)-dependent oxidoreductase [Alphaproteobacteria bacterium]|nr:NAD(P)-dependent oxidoreductase [Alphaproteobacteria bacterium]